MMPESGMASGGRHSLSDQELMLLEINEIVRPLGKKAFNLYFRV